MLGTLLLSTIFLTDTTATAPHHLDEVVVVSYKQGGKRSAKGQTASIDEHLSELSHVELVRRGSYAWEPMVNNMQTERLSTTIDGMKIFYACTDKMDPVTSYVESGNLQSISLNAGLNGNPQATGNIGGSLDLRLRKVGFAGAPFHLNTSVGYEANGQLQVYGADATHSSRHFYIGGGAFYRHADNYKSGGGDRLPFSQFQKVNAFVNTGLKLTDNDVMETTLIVDRASDVGYPALNMDVAKAEAFITSLSYKHLFVSPLFNSWETKVYYNHIVHEMDDTHRPDVEIHMDMPGRSWTAGAYSLLTGSVGRHETSLNVDGYYNRLFADMTMYPGGAAPMYMVTWPDVGTLNMGVSFSDRIILSSLSVLHLSAKVSWQQQRLNNEEGHQALSVFFPGMRRQYHQTTGRMAASYQLSLSDLRLSVGAGWGSRAPTVTESYGYYLNNTFDQYDYIGNPRLKNESAVEVNAAINWQPDKTFSIGIDGNAFLFTNYIIGQFETRLSPMTVGAEGVKVYGNISHAIIANASLTIGWKPFDGLDWSTTLAFSLGHDEHDDPLPLIAPFSYTSRLTYSTGRLRLLAEVKGHVRHTAYGVKYGEKETPGWVVCNLSTSYTLQHVTLRTGIENILDRFYTTYADWNGIPQKGRNIYLNISFEL